MTGQLRRARAPFVATSYALGFIVLCIVVYVMNLAEHIMVPLVMAVFIWYLINAIARGLMSLERYEIRMSRFICFGLAIALLLGGLWAIFDLIKSNAAQVAAAAPAYQKQFDIMEPKVLSLMGLDHIPTVPEIVQKIDLASILKYLAAVLTGITVTTIEVLFFTGFLLYEQRFFDQKIQGMITDGKLEHKIRHILANIDDKIQRYIAVKTLVSLLASIATYVILRIAHVDFAAFWGLMAFFLHFIPYAGTFGAIALPAIMSLVQFGDVGTFLSVAVALSVALMAIGHVLDPRLLGDRLNLSPICIILSLAVWKMIWGVPGMFLAIPLLSMMVITMSQFEATRPIAVLLSKTGVVEKALKPKG